MRAISGIARHFSWEPPVPARQHRAAAMIGAALEEAARSTLGGLVATVGRARIIAAGAMRRVWRWCLVNRNIRELSRLDDHLLQDIGLQRAEILASVQRRVAEIEITGRYRYR